MLRKVNTHDVSVKKSKDSTTTKLTGLERGPRLGETSGSRRGAGSLSQAGGISPQYRPAKMCASAVHAGAEAELPMRPALGEGARAGRRRGSRGAASSLSS